MDGARTFAFGPFLFIPERQLLMRGEAVVRIGCRALDLLALLVERPGELVTKAELIARVWPTTTVDEANLKVNMAVLRKALADDAVGARYVATVTGRGYRFVAPVRAKLPANPPQRPSANAPSEPGARLRFVDFPPAPGGDGQWGGEALDAIDYGIVIDGEVTLFIDGAPVLLTPGSLVIRRGIDPRWANHSDKPARMLFVERGSGRGAIDGALPKLTRHDDRPDHYAHNKRSVTSCDR